VSIAKQIVLNTVYTLTQIGEKQKFNIHFAVKVHVLPSKHFTEVPSLETSSYNNQ